MQTPHTKRPRKSPTSPEFASMHILSTLNIKIVVEASSNFSLDQIPHLHLIPWFENFVESHSFRVCFGQITQN